MPPACAQHDELKQRTAATEVSIGNVTKRLADAERTAETNTSKLVDTLKEVAALKVQASEQDAKSACQDDKIERLTTEVRAWPPLIRSTTLSSAHAMTPKGSACTSSDTALCPRASVRCPAHR